LSDANDVPFAWTPDSQAVVFISDRNGNVNIFRQAIHGAMAERHAASLRPGVGRQAQARSKYQFFWPTLRTCPDNECRVAARK
jgi:WD40 repeat protein